jgi:D-alanyl-D-alanine carboxypeptidase (penicillin-binding protein 5/6)
VSALRKLAFALRRPVVASRPHGRVRLAALLAAVALAAAGACACRSALAVPEGPPPDAAAGPNVTASSAMLVDAVTGTVLWEKNANQRRPMASTTKIMTATLIIELARMTDRVTVSQQAVRTPYAGLHAKPGEQIGMQDLLYAILLRSANDGCVAAAEHLAGSEAAFVSLMNQRARQIGAVDTHFVTSNGLHDPAHYTTAADLVRMTRYAIRHPLFNEVVRTPQYRITSRTVNRNDTLLENHNHFLGSYAGADGVKTGYIRQAGKCLVASATRAEGNYPWRLLSVVLNSRDIYADSAALLDYGFRNYQPVFFARQGDSLGSARVAGGLFSRVPLIAAEDLLAIVPRWTSPRVESRLAVSHNLRAPLKQDQVVGNLRGYLDGQLVTSTPIIAGEGVAVSWAAGMSEWGSWSLLAMLLMAFGPRYARAVAKGARRRRRGVASQIGDPDLGWAGERQWADRPGTWD